MKHRAAGMAVLLLYLSLVGGVAPVEPAESVVRLAAPADILESGLPQVLMARFQEATGLRLILEAAGPGEAPGLVERGAADVVLLDTPEDLERIVNGGLGVGPRPVMRSPLLIAGPAGDPAAIRGKGPAKALSAIAQARAPFVSRADRSAVHRVERGIWERAGISPRGPWYIEARRGTADVLRLTAERGGYTLADRGTYLTLRGGLSLSPLVQGHKALEVQYSVVEARPGGRPAARAEAARRLAGFLVSAQARELIRSFGMDRHREPLFLPEEVP